MIMKNMLSIIGTRFLLITLIGCTHRVEFCNIIDETPEKKNIVDISPYSNNINLILVEGGVPDDCHQEMPVVPNRVLKMAINDSLMRRGFYSNSPHSAYTLHVVLDPVVQIFRKNDYRVTTTLKATLRNRNSNMVIFNERFESTINAPDDSGFFPCCRLKVATELSMRETIIKLIQRIKLVAFPPVPSAHPEPIPPREPGAPDLI